MKSILTSIIVDNDYKWQVVRADYEMRWADEIFMGLYNDLLVALSLKISWVLADIDEDLFAVFRYF